MGVLSAPAVRPAVALAGRHVEAGVNTDRRGPPLVEKRAGFFPSCPYWFEGIAMEYLLKIVAVFFFIKRKTHMYTHYHTRECVLLAHV